MTWSPSRDKPGTDGEVRLLGGDGVLERDVEHPLFPVDLGVLAEPRPADDVGKRGVVGVERAVGGQRYAQRPGYRRGQAPAVLVELDVVANPEVGRVVESAVDPGEVEKAGGVSRDVQVPERLQGHPEQQRERLALGPDKPEHRDFVGNVVGDDRRGLRDQQQDHDGQSAQ